MILNSIYISVVFTNWSFAKIGDTTWRYSGESYYTPMVVKLINAGVFGLLYTWTMVAPAIFKNRNFSTDFKKEFEMR